MAGSRRPGQGLAVLFMVMLPVALLPAAVSKARRYLGDVPAVHLVVALSDVLIVAASAFIPRTRGSVLDLGASERGALLAAAADPLRVASRP